MSKAKWILGIFLLVVIGVLILSRDAIMAAWAKLTAGNGGGDDDVVVPPKPQFPVCLKSSAADIKAAFIKSGMMVAYHVAWTNGTYGADYATWSLLEQAIFADPVQWLENHPYLYNAYPDYFVAP